MAAVVAVAFLVFLGFLYYTTLEYLKFKQKQKALTEHKETK